MECDSDINPRTASMIALLAIQQVIIIFMYISNIDKYYSG